MAGPGTRGGIVEYFAPGDRITCKVDESAGIAGGNVVTLTASREVGLCGASDFPFGVAMHDAADNTMVSIATEGVWPLKASGAISAGNTVVCAAAGAVVADLTPDLQLYVGIALEDIADTAVGPVKLRM